MQIPGLGQVTKDDDLYYSEPRPIPMFGGKVCRIVVDRYDQDKRKEEFHVAIANFLAGGPAVLRAADEPLFRFYKDSEEWWVEGGQKPIRSGDELWRHVRLGSEPTVSRRHYGDRGIYISIECGCDWEDEHGMQLVLKNGLKVCKLGGFDGHLSHADAYADKSLEDVIYPNRE